MTNPTNQASGVAERFALIELDGRQRDPVFTEKSEALTALAYATCSFSDLSPPWLRNLGNGLRVLPDGSEVAPPLPRAAGNSSGVAELHGAIMNIECIVPKDANVNQALSYKYGHRDARHAAAELVAASQAASHGAPAEPVDLHEFNVRLSEYGIAMYHGQGEKARVLADVLASMFEASAPPVPVGVETVAPDQSKACASVGVDWQRQARAVVDVHRSGCVREYKVAHEVAVSLLEAALASPAQAPAATEAPSEVRALIEEAKTMLAMAAGANSSNRGMWKRDVNGAAHRLAAALSLLAAPAPAVGAAPEPDGWKWEELTQWDNDPGCVWRTAVGEDNPGEDKARRNIRPLFDHALAAVGASVQPVLASLSERERFMRDELGWKPPKPVVLASLSDQPATDWDEFGAYKLPMRKNPCGDCGGSGMDGDVGEQGQAVTVNCAKCGGTGEEPASSTPTKGGEAS